VKGFALKAFLSSLASFERKIFAGKSVIIRYVFEHGLPYFQRKFEIFRSHTLSQASCLETETECLIRDTKKYH
jgi:hypothetical protein